ncbi:MAG: circadian clock protein KaiB [Gammaproteobacteria bacterium]|nr:circadian clock protein KaiB [Gammaproteobacteria bacterium]
MANAKYIYKLYIAGISTDNQVGILALKKRIKDKTKGDYLFEVIDVLEQPEMAMEDKVLATPTIVRQSPSPAVAVILDFTTQERMLMGFDLIFNDEKQNDA